ncbi:MAG TPA: hypothetical protein V6D00_07820 [Pantanalinema sp.]
MSLTHFLASYLFAFLFWWGIALGCLFILMLQNLTGGRWGGLLRPILEAASRTLPVLAVCFLPVLIGASALYPWAQPGAATGLHQAAYLNPLFFMGRSVVYFTVWIALAWRLTREPARSVTALSAAGLLLYAFTVSFASIDWIMSLEPHWSSSIYGLLIGMGQVLSAFAFAIAVFCRRSALESSSKPSDLAGTFNDLGNLLLTAVMTWAYLAFMQVLIIWMGNLPHENPWVLARTAGAWRWAAIGLTVLQFAVPAWLLLFRSFKRRAPVLGGIALGLLMVHLLEVYWLVLPAFFPSGPRPSVWDLALPLAIGGVWLWAFGWQLRRRPLTDAQAREGFDHG